MIRVIIKGVWMSTIRANIQNNHPAQPARVVRPNFNPPNCDPVSRAERETLTLNPDIGSNGEALYNSEAFCIVHRYESKEQEEIRKNIECGIGPVDNAQAYILMECRFDQLYDDNDWIEELEAKQEYSLYLQETYDYEDDGLSCKFNVTYDDAENTGEENTLDAPDGNGAIISEDALPSPEDTELTAEPTAEQDEAPGVTADATEPPPIETDIKLSESFGNAAAEPNVGAELEQAPTAPLPTTTPAANAPSYQMSA
jgi:hypothetical protein